MTPATHQPSPLAGEGGSRRLTDEGSVDTHAVSNFSPLASAPSSGASRHLLPQGEKDGRDRKHLLPQGEKEGRVRNNHLPQGEKVSKVKFARHLRRNMTDVEVKLWNALRGRRFEEFKFRRQVPVGIYIADFMCFEKRLIIELDGSQHEGSVRDEIRDAWLKAQGFYILRFWNIDINQALDGTLLAILDRLK